MHMIRRQQLVWILPFYPRAVALPSYTVVDKIIENTVGFTRKDIRNDYN